MALEYIRHHYGVPAEIGRRVRMDGKEGVIAEDMGHHVGVLFDTDKPNRISQCHPTWRMEYLGMGIVRKMTASQRCYHNYLAADSGCTFAEWLGIDKISLGGKS